MKEVSSLAVRYIMGRAGSGKSRLILEEIRSCLQDGGREALILLVPEQFTLQAENDLVTQLNLPGIMRVEVLSLSRMCRRVLDEVGGRTRVLLNDQGRYMMLKKMIASVEKHLTIFRKTARQPGFVDECSRIIMELKSHDISVNALLEYQSQLPETMLLKEKLQDISVLYAGFNRQIAGRYLDTEDYLNLAVEAIPRAEFLQGARIWADNFTTFSPQALKLIGQLLAQAVDVTISLTMPLGGEDRDRELFSLSRYYYNHIHLQVLALGLQEKFISVKALPDQNRSPEALHLEQELYAYPHRSYTSVPEHLGIAAAANLQDEVEYLAMRIMTLVKNNGLRFRDIAVVCSDIASYENLVQRVFDEYKIPFFLDSKKSIRNHPVIEMILAVMDIAIRNFRSEDVFRYLKTGFSPLSGRACDLLENYALRYGIERQRWLQPFCLGDERLLAEAEAWRQALIESLAALVENLHTDCTWEGITTRLFAWLEQRGIAARLGAIVEDFRSRGRYQQASENAQIWNVLVDVFDQMVEAMGDREVSLKEYQQVLEAGLSSCELGLIPPTIDQVMVGTAQRSINHTVKALFVIGVNDGLLPRGGDQEGLLSSDERDYLLDQGLQMGLERDIRAAEEQFLIYSALSKGQQLIHISYALSDNEGKAMRASLLVDRLKQLYPGLEVALYSSMQAPGSPHFLLTPDSAFKYLIENLRQALDGKTIHPVWWEAYRWYWQQPHWQPQMISLEEALFFSNDPGFIKAHQVPPLYGKSRRSSVSRLERFSACPFAHFVCYGLRPQERRFYEIQAPDIGELFHQALLGFGTRIQEKGLNWDQLDRKGVEGLIEQVMDELLPTHDDGVFLSTHRYQYLGRRLKRIARRAVWTLAQHIQKGEFRPLGYELRFGAGGSFPAVEVTLADGTSVALEGRIDRVDLYDDGEISYVRILDYKSGNQVLDLNDVYYGLSLQLLIYLQAVLAGQEQLSHQHALPAGIFYFKLDDPMVETDSEIQDEIERKIAAQLKLRGLVLEDVRIVRAMERDVAGHAEILPVQLLNSGGFSSRSAVMDLAGFEVLVKHVLKLVCELSQDIQGGNIQIKPVKKNRLRACRTCDYHPVCHFDTLFAGNSERLIRDLGAAELMERFRQPGTGGASNAAVD